MYDLECSAEGCGSSNYGKRLQQVQKCIKRIKSWQAWEKKKTIVLEICQILPKKWQGKGFIPSLQIKTWNEKKKNEKVQNKY